MLLHLFLGFTTRSSTLFLSLGRSFLPGLSSSLALLNGLLNPVLPLFLQDLLQNLLFLHEKGTKNPRANTSMASAAAVAASNGFQTFRHARAGHRTGGLNSSELAFTVTTFRERAKLLLVNIHQFTPGSLDPKEATKLKTDRKTTTQA